MPNLDTHPRATLAGPPSDELLLAAVERAGRHRAPGARPEPRSTAAEQARREAPSVPAAAIWTILEHLAVPRRSKAARGVRARLEVLEAAGSLERSRRGGVQTWRLTSAGCARLRRARRAGEVPRLPESPQHRAWRDARMAATQEIERFRARLRERLREGARLLGAEEPAHSDAWLELGEELQRDCRRLASATHCLREWLEPSDCRSDVDERADAGDGRLDAAERARQRARRAGRRNIRLWADRPGA